MTDMTITLPRDQFLSTLDAVRGAVDRKPTIPILGNVLVRVDDGTLRITANNLDIEARAECAEQVRGTAAMMGFTAPAELLGAFLRKLPSGGEISIVVPEKPGTVILRAGRTRAQMLTLPTHDFPEFPTKDLTHTFEIPTERLAWLIEKTFFATSTEASRYYLNGIYLHAAGEMLRAVATDGHRLARADVALPEGAEGMPGIIVPNRTIAEIRSLLKNAGEVVWLGCSQDRIRLTSGPITLTSKLVDGTFPDYGRVIPPANDRIVEVDIAALHAAVERVSTITSERGKAVKFTFEPNRIRLEARASEMGEATDEVEASYDGKPIETGFNSRYVLDILGAIDGERARLSLHDPGSPALIEPADGEGLTIVLMPLRV